MPGALDGCGAGGSVLRRHLATTTSPARWLVAAALVVLGLSARTGPIAASAFVPPQPPRVVGAPLDWSSSSASERSGADADARSTRLGSYTSDDYEGAADENDDDEDEGGAPSAGTSPVDSPRRRQRRRKRQERRADASANVTPYGNILADSTAFGPTADLIDAGANAAVFSAMLEQGGLVAEEEDELEVQGSEEGMEAEADDDLQETLRGGPSLIFAMARRMLVWDDESYAGQNDTYKPDGRRDPGGSTPLKAAAPKAPVADAGAAAPAASGATAAPPRRSSSVLPRWHPHPGISDVNPSFRRSAPVMNNAGYLGAIRRNARKRSKPSLWRYALRSYDRMRQLEAEQARVNEVIEAGTGTGKPKRKKLKIKRTRGHHEGALVACAKLGLWREALQIYGEVEQEEENAVSAALGGNGAAPETEADVAAMAAVRRKVQQKGLGISDGMVLGLVKACVRGSKSKAEVSPATTTATATTSADATGRAREPLDAARDVLTHLEEERGLTPEPKHANPLAAAYQALGLRSEAAELLQSILPDRPKLVQSSRRNGRKMKRSPPTLTKDQAVVLDDAPEDTIPSATKDRASYSLLVGGAVADEDWEGAVEALRDMTDSGLYPTGRALNAWSEAGEGSAGERKGRSKRSWRRRRDEYWLESLR